MRKKYAECANLRIGILSSSQRLTEVNKKFRAKMHGYLIGYLNPDEYIGIIERMLNKTSKNPTQILNPTFRHKFLYTPDDTVIQVSKFMANGKPREWIPKPEPQKQKPKPKKLIQKIMGFFKPKIPEYRPATKETEEIAEEEEEEEFPAWEL